APSYRRILDPGTFHGRALVHRMRELPQGPGVIIHAVHPPRCREALDPEKARHTAFRSRQGVQPPALSRLPLGQHRLVAEKLVDATHDLWRQQWNHLQCIQVVLQLLYP
ncbi:MAG: hypothetical protein RLZZ165_2515, partial [Bacteroidota bacterium]